ncbi:hypothetical protein Q1695_010306 [Nippostrongylus brasiliensis]|nr:hypothetical protein Q1695_010306 [Nippostrongylus brasiliensis]
MSSSFRRTAKWILRNTILTDQSLTPELRLHLITKESSLWKARPEDCPFPDPYWAFYWPGGQAVTRYILDNTHLFHGANVLDFGCGCGSAAIACSMARADQVIANDIDQTALISTFVNYRKNHVSTRRVQFSSDNMLDFESDNVDKLQRYLQAEKSFILLGDMFYDVEFAEKLFTWLRRMKASSSVRILAGDPNRHPLEEKQLQRYTTKIGKKLLAQYTLPECVQTEHYGFSTVSVFDLQ